MADIIGVDAPAIAGLREMQANLPRAREHALDEVANLGMRAKDRQISNTYRRGVPRGRNGRPKYVRTGNYRRNQRIVKATGRRSIEPYGRVRLYEPRLATLNTPRRNAAAQNAVQVITPQVPQVYEQALKNDLGIR